MLSLLSVVATAPRAIAEPTATPAAVDSAIDPSDYLVAPDPVLAAAPTDAAPQGSAASIEELEARVNELELALSGLPAAAPPAATEKPDPKRMTAKWGENGFTAASADGDFKIHLGGRVQLDAVALNTDDLVLGGVGDQDAVDFRRARLRVDGTMYETMEWVAEFDFVNAVDLDPTGGGSPINANGGDVAQTVAPTDLWWAFHEVPYAGNVRIGNQKAPIGLEHVQSSRFLDFMERSFLQDAFFGQFDNGFSPGIALYDWNESETVTWSLGGYKNTQNIFAYDTGDNEYALTGRLTCVPWSACADRRLLHLGVASSFRGLDQDAAVTTGNVRVRSRASLRNGPGPLNPNLADTNFAGRIFAENQTLLAPEASLVLGPWQLQSEYVAGYLNSATFTPIAGAPVDADQVFVHGSYVQLLYFLTGEHRAYDRHEARFGRVVPAENLSLLPNRGGLDGLGAWQIGARYGYLDLDDGLVQGGYIQDLTLGLNWFLNPHTKLQFNAIFQHVDNTLRDTSGAITANNDGDLTGFGVRFAHDF